MRAVKAKRVATPTQSQAATRELVQLGIASAVNTPVKATRQKAPRSVKAAKPKRRIGTNAKVATTKGPKRKARLP